MDIKMYAHWHLLRRGFRLLYVFRFMYVGVAKTVNVAFTFIEKFTFIIISKLSQWTALGEGVPKAGTEDCYEWTSFVISTVFSSYCAKIYNRTIIFIPIPNIYIRIRHGENISLSIEKIDLHSTDSQLKKKRPSARKKRQKRRPN